MFCPECRKENPDGAKFCINCGFNLKEFLEKKKQDSEKEKEPFVMDSIIQRSSIDMSKKEMHFHAVPLEDRKITKIGEFCPICGKLVKDDYFKCRNCGRNYLCLDHFINEFKICEECVPALKEKVKKSETAKTKSPKDSDIAFEKVKSEMRSNIKFRNRQIQQELKRLGYYSGKIDGIAGPLTIKAIKSFQRDYDLKVNGIVGKRTYDALFKFRNINTQRRLKDLGLYSGKIDGIIGPLSSEAIKRFQRNQGLVADGIVGPKTWNALFKDINREE